MTIGKFLETLRKEKGLTQAQVAENLGVSDRTISAWETGSRLPDIYALSDLADFYGVTADEILHGARKGEPPAAEEPRYAQCEEAEEKRRILSIQTAGLSGILCAAVLAIFLSSFFAGYGSRNTLLFLLLLIGGALALVVCAGFSVSLYKLACNVPRDFRAQQKILAKRILFRGFYVAAALMAALALAVLVAMATPLFDYLNDVSALIMMLFFAAAFAICFIGSYILHRDLLRLGDKRAIEVSARNRRRLVRCYIFGCIPVFLSVVSLIVCTLWKPERSELIYSSTEQGLVEYLQTVTVGNCADFGPPAGEYVLDVSAADPSILAEPQPVGGGFYCRFYTGRCEVVWMDGEGIYTVAEGWAVAVGNKIAYDFRYGIDYGMNCIPVYEWIRLHSYSREVIQTAEGYGIIGVYTYAIKNLGFLLAACLTGTDIVVCTAICLIKYKRIPLETE